MRTTELKLPYDESLLKMRDATGNRAKRRAGGFWAARVETCRAKVSQWKGEKALYLDKLEEAEDEQSREDCRATIKNASARIRNWEQELGAAEENLTEIKQLVTAAWN